MQAGKNAAAAMKEAVANVGASAQSGKEKTKAVVEEKIETMAAHGEADKERARELRQEKIHEAELNKRQAQVENAAAKEATRVYGNREEMARHGLPDFPTYSHQMSATTLQEQGKLGEPHGLVGDGVVKSHPPNARTTDPTAGALNPPCSGSTAQTGYGTGGGYMS